MYRLKFQRTGFAGVGFIVGTRDEIERFLALPGVKPVADPYNPEWVHAPIEDDEGEAETCNHKWVYTGIAYGGEDDSFHGEGRCYCSKCGADGDA